MQKEDASLSIRWALRCYCSHVRSRSACRICPRAYFALDASDYCRNSQENWVGTRANPFRPAFEIGTCETRHVGGCRFLERSRWATMRDGTRRHGEKERAMYDPAGPEIAERGAREMHLPCISRHVARAVPSIARSGYGSAPRPVKYRKYREYARDFEDFMLLEISPRDYRVKSRARMQWIRQPRVLHEEDYESETSHIKRFT